jgi:hypothetical protein
MTLHDHLADLALSIQVAIDRSEAYAALDRFRESSGWMQLSPDGRMHLLNMVGRRARTLPLPCDD